MYPWEADPETGVDHTPHFAYGVFREIHVNADIAIAQWQYYLATSDRATLAERPEAHWTLESLSALVGYSPFHLAHQFRAYTGTSVHQYLSSLRAAAALRRIEAGDTSLATIAVDLEFAHHSHLTATLRKRLGMTPQMIRRRLRCLEESRPTAGSVTSRESPSGREEGRDD